MTNIKNNKTIVCITFIVCAVAIAWYFIRGPGLEITVKKLILNIGDANRQVYSIKCLEFLGEPAVPYIIDNMDDHRPVTLSVKFRNKSYNSVDEYRYYNPKEVVDVLAALLNQITGESFGDIYNGETIAVREKTVDRWKIYLKEKNGRGHEIKVRH